MVLRRSRVNHEVFRARSRAPRILSMQVAWKMVSVCEGSTLVLIILKVKTLNILLNIELLLMRLHWCTIFHFLFRVVINMMS